MVGPCRLEFSLVVLVVLARFSFKLSTLVVVFISRLKRLLSILNLSTLGIFSQPSHYYKSIPIRKWFDIHLNIGISF